MKFYNLTLILLLGSLWAGATCCSPDKEIVLSSNGTNYTFNLRDLEAHLKKQYNCSLDIRVNGPEIINAANGDKALIIHNPHLTEREGKLSFSMSPKAWECMKNHADWYQYCQFRRAFDNVVLDERMQSSFTTAIAMGFFFSLYNLYKEPNNLMPKISIVALSALSYFIYYIDTMISGHCKNRVILEKGIQPKTVFGFEKIGESDKPEPLVHISTDYDIRSLAHIVA